MVDVNNNLWTPREIATMRKMLDGGYGPSDIATRLGRTVRSVQKRVKAQRDIERERAQRATAAGQRP
jgi:hypothetical protein